MVDSLKVAVIGVVCALLISMEEVSNGAENVVEFIDDTNC